ncbi:DUF4352 domain-containing protein [Saccharothrix saharensis]|uniref:DUF4352 domain-containing protein n=1 Tax=Saccharothrix saharensis TaxID=571190 RepID=UPI00367B06EA
MATRGQAPQGPAPGTPRKRSKFKTVLVLLAVIAGIVIIAKVAGNEDPGPSADQAGSPTPAEQAAVPEAAHGAPMGTSVRDGKFEFTVQGAEKRARVGTGDFLTRAAQGEFLLVRMTVKNIGDQPQSFFGENQKAFDASGRQYSADSAAAVYLADAKSLYEEINPGNQVAGVVVFDVPAGTGIVKVELHDSAFSDGAAVVLAH